MAETIKIGGELESTATGNVVAAASAIKDKTKNKYQDMINAETGETLAQHEIRLNAFTEGNFVTVSSYSALPNPGNIDTVYRVSSWDGNANSGAGAVDVTKYTEYAWNGSSYILLDVKTQIGEVFDISEYTNDTYDDLADALGTDGANVPVGIRRGGMSVKFVCTSDNKYAQFRLMSDEFTTDTTQWAVCDESIYVENPEFVKVELDRDGRILEAIKKDGTKLLGAGAEIEGDVMLKGKAEITSIENPEFAAVRLDDNNHILYGVQKDGNFFFGCGVPKQIEDYISKKIEELSLDEYEDIVAFLNDLEKGDKTLQDLLDEKVDKEGGKSLIDVEYANGVSYMENPEFAEVKVDNEDRILEAITKDGTKVIGGDLKVLGNMEVSGVSYKVIENPEYLAAWIDAEDKIIFGFKTDGKTYVGDADFLDDVENIKAFLANFNDKNIDWDALTSITVTENPEYIEVKTDAEDKILEATEKDGTKLFGGDVKVLGSIDVGGVSYKVVSNPEWLKVVVDSENRIICGIKTDGKFVVYVADFLDDIEAIKSRLKELDAYSVTENPEFMEVELDANDKVLSGRKVDGTKFENNDVELNGNATVGGSLEVDGVVIKNIEDPEERSEITTDAKGRILHYRKKDGTLVENVGIETNHLELTKQGMSDFQQALKDSGFQPGGGGDWSERENIELPMPKHYSLLNIAVDSLPINDGQVSEGYIEYYDGLGNYFKMDCSLEPQGQSSRIFARTGGKGNYTLDLPKDIKFGSWVPQDSFHLKGAAKDVSRGMLATSYKLAYPIQEYLNAQPDRVLVDDSGITVKNSTGVRINDWFRDARCLPDGFPVEVYVNGEYWGLYAWQLKKHRKNYSMDKKDYTSFFIDPDRIMTSNYQNGIWNDGPDATIPDTELTWWTGFDIKGPKDLVCMDGSAFDGDNPKELIDSTSPVYDSSNKKHKGSQTTKNLIRSFQTKYLEVKALIDNDSIEDAKAAFNANFDYNSCMLVYIYNCLMMNGDSISKNTLWGMYKSGKIFPLLWDLDAMYGQEWTGTWVYNPGVSTWNTYANAAWPLALFATLYETEIKAAYSALRRDGVVSIDSWESIVFGQWFKKIGQSAFERDLERWPETPSYRENYTNTDYWVELGISREGDYPVWNAETSYNTNDIVQLPMYNSTSWYIKYKAVQGSTNKCPVTKFYDGFPQVGGYYDSPKRWQKWMDKQIMLCDVQNDYFEELRADFTAYRTTDSEYEIECTNMTVDTKLSKTYNYIQGHITRHEIEVEGQTVSTYTIDGGAETPEDTSKTYTTVRAAIEIASSQPVDIPSENVYYIQARAKDITYYKK